MTTDQKPPSGRFPADVGPVGDQLSEFLSAGMDALAGQQLPSGEIPSFRRDADGRWRYGLNLLVSTLVHDALGCFDPASPWGESQTTDLLHPALLPRFLAQVANIRKRIQAFLAWQEEANGGWKSAGRGSGQGLDAASTACAAAALMEGNQRAEQQPWRRHLQTLTDLRVEASTNSTLDSLADAHIARLLALTGEESAPLLEALIRRVEEKDRAETEHHSLMVLIHAMARIYRHGLFPGQRAMAEILVPRVLARRKDPDVWVRSLAITALLDLGFTDFKLGDDYFLLLGATTSITGWEKGYGPAGPSSPALTLALALTSLARWQVANGGFSQ